MALLAAGIRWRRPSPQDRRTGADGFDYALRHRLTAVDVDTRQFSLHMQVWQWSNGELVAHETHSLVINSYTSSEIVAALHAAGFDDVGVVGGYDGHRPTGGEETLLYIARRPPAPH